MTEQFVRDAAAIFLIAGGLFVTWLEILEFRRCDKSYRWIYIIKAAAGFSVSFIFLLALLRLYPGGADTIDPRLGRPVFVLILAALALGAIRENKLTGRC